MNEYQESLNSLKSAADYNFDADGNKIIHDGNMEAVSTLQELVDRATPKKMKSIEFDGLRTYGNCPNCGSFHIKDGSTHCYHCGQALDWEKEGK